MAELSEIVGKTLSCVSVSEDRIDFTFTDGSEYAMFHRQECCESVTIESIDGPIDRLVGQVIVDARKESNNEVTDSGYAEDESKTWTFYILRTNLDSVTIRWFGTSNGYYSETAEFEMIKAAGGNA